MSELQWLILKWRQRERVAFANTHLSFLATSGWDWFLVPFFLLFIYLYTTLWHSLSWDQVAYSGNKSAPSLSNDLIIRIIWSAQLIFIVRFLPGAYGCGTLECCSRDGKEGRSPDCSVCVYLGDASINSKRGSPLHNITNDWSFCKLCVKSSSISNQFKMNIAASHSLTWYRSSKIGRVALWLETEDRR